jgi:hypothetical protein
MLNNQFETEKGNESLTQRRVTPDEFSAAVAEIQKRKAEEERILADTVQVDEVVRDLNLDVSPEEILKEVEAQRKARAAAAMPKTPRPPRSFAPLVEEVQTQVATRGFFRSKKQRDAVVGWISTVALIVVVGNVLGNNVSNDFFSQINALIGSDAVSAPLTSYNFAKPAAIDNDQLNSLINGADPSKVTIMKNGDLDSNWTIEKLGSKYYIWAWVDGNQLSSSVITLYNDEDDVPEHNDEKLTVPTSSLSGSFVSGAGENSSIAVKNLKLDEQAHDAWADGD